ncbi:MAG: lipopolysaccharide transport periplasmic protein LptA [Paracoccaceae bacterium]
MLPLVLLTLATATFAQGTQIAFGAVKQDPDLPVEVTAENLSVDQETGQAVFTGNVVVGQGVMRLSSDRLLVVYPEDTKGIERMEATGSVTLVSGPDAAEAERADYNVRDGVIVMTGNVLLSQGPQVLTADRMTVDLDSGTAKMSGSVKTILQTGD